MHSSLSERKPWIMRAGLAWTGSLFNSKRLLVETNRLRPRGCQCKGISFARFSRSRFCTPPGVGCSSCRDTLIFASVSRDPANDYIRRGCRSSICRRFHGDGCSIDSPGRSSSPLSGRRSTSRRSPTLALLSCSLAERWPLSRTIWRYCA